jgi:small-conductance mechanosensitive channel
MDFASTLRDFLDVRLFEVGGTAVTVASIGTFVLIVVGSLWVSRVLKGLVGRATRRGGVSEQETVLLVQRAVHYLVLITGVAVALHVIGINLATVFAAGAVVAVAVGFALQNILQNFVSGVILLVERSIGETDVLEIDGRVIRVERIGIRATVARTRSDEQMVIPNSELVQGIVTNYTLEDSLNRVGTEVGVSYSSDMRRVRDVLERAAATVPERATEKDPVVLMREFGDSSVVWSISIWTDDPWHALGVRSALNEAVWFALQDAGVTIAFPQVDVHFPGGPPATV